MELSSREVHQGWTLVASGDEVPPHIAGVRVPAEVPGSAHTDLLTAGLIPDPYLGQNESALQWAWRTTWTYSTGFEAAPPEQGERVDLVFEGLDTIATVTLNGTEIAQTHNMHRTYRFDVGALLRADGNELTVRFDPALTHAEAEVERTGEKLHVEAHPFNAIRKMACSFGWDWGPDLQTAGMWRPVRVERWTKARLASVLPEVTVDGDTGRVVLRVEVERAPGDHSALALALALTATVGGVEASVQIPAEATEARLELEVPGAQRWWPVGYGAQPLYDLAVALRAGEDLLATWNRRIGFRSIELDTTPDQIGAPFTLVVNGVRIFVKGANWIPDDHLITRVTRERLARRFTQALDANMNLLRIWGGGVYESDDFYELADEVGLMVWQDALFACAAYDEGPSMRAEVEAEVTDNITRLMPHPSLVLYNGSNENIWGFFQFGWSMLIADENWGLGYYMDVLPRLIGSLDPTRPYTPSSPYSPHHTHTDLDPNHPDWGTVHEWKVWNSIDYTHYRDYVPRFSSEFGFQGPATWATITRSLPPEGLDQNHAAWLAHQKADSGNEKLGKGLEPHLPVPADFEEWHWATQLNQARAVAFAIEHYRSHWPRCAGAIVWQLNDCWPVTSWAAIDGDERKKPLWYALRHAYAPRLLTFQPRDGQLHLVAVNDTDEPWEGDLTLRRLRLDGTELGISTEHLAVPPREVQTFTVPSHLAAPEDATGEVLVADAGHPAGPATLRAVHTWVEDKLLAYEVAPYEATAEHDGADVVVTLKARGFVRDLTILADKIDPSAEASDALLALLPGESVTIRLTSHTPLSLAKTTAPGVLMSVNSLCGRASAAETRS